MHNALYCHLIYYFVFLLDKSKSIDLRIEFNYHSKILIDLYLSILHPSPF